MNFNKITSAALMALLWTACSDNDVAGGTEEETCVYSLAGRVGDVYPALLRSTADENGSEDSLKNDGSVFAAKGTVVSVYELDSLTLEKTGRSFVDTVDNDSGRFAFESLALNSGLMRLCRQA